MEIEVVEHKSPLICYFCEKPCEMAMKFEANDTIVLSFCFMCFVTILKHNADQLRVNREKTSKPWNPTTIQG
jgi:hypothetical protein